MPPRFRNLPYLLFSQMMGAKLSGGTFQIIMVIIDHTIGYKRQDAPISLTRFQDQTSLTRQGVIRAIQDAERRHIIQVNRENLSPKRGASYAIAPVSEWWTGKLPRKTKQLVNRSSPVTSQRELTSTSKQGLTSKVVNGSLPNQSTGVDQTSQHASFATPVQINPKETLKEYPSPNSPPNEKTTTPRSSLTDKELLPTSRVTGLEDGNGTKHHPELGDVASRRKASAPVKRVREAVQCTVDYTNGAEPAIGELASEARAGMNEVADVLWYLEEPASIADIAAKQTFGDSAQAERILKVLKKHGWVKQDGDTWQCVKTIRGAA